MPVVKDGSNAPEERVNLVYKTDTGGETPEKELPLKLLVVGDFTGKPSEQMVEERQAYAIKQPTDFENVLKASDVSLNMQVPDVRDSDKSAGDLSVNLEFKELKDFDPDRIAARVPELKQLLDLRDELLELKGPLANDDKFRRRIQEILNDKQQSILDELGLGSGQK